MKNNYENIILLNIIHFVINSLINYFINIIFLIIY